MKRQKGSPFKEQLPPTGFSFTKYSDGDDLHWAEIETSVGEFKDVQDGLRYFQDHYLPAKDEVLSRVVFLRNGAGEKIGTLSSWWNYTDDSRNSSLHWVAIKPEFQGKGLGRPLINYGIKTQIELDGDCDIYIHTQTWSHRAIALYLKEGFHIIEKETFGGYKNDFEAALPFLQEKIGKILCK